MPKLRLIPGSSEVFAILDGHVKGAHRIQHDALKPYVRVEPEAPGGTITLTASDRLRLPGQVQRLTCATPMDFVILFDRDGMRLLPVSPPDSRTLPLANGPAVIPEPILVTPSPEAVRPPTRRARLRVAPDVVPAPATKTELPIPEWLLTLCLREAVEASLGDYLVIPATLYPDMELPAWIARSAHVEAVHVVKPRLREDREVRDGE